MYHRRDPDLIKTTLEELFLSATSITENVCFQLSLNDGLWNAYSGAAAAEEPPVYKMLGMPPI